MPCNCLRGQQQRKLNMVRSLGEQRSAEKQCHDCERTLPIGSFYKDYSYKDGFAHICKACLIKAGTVNYAKRRVRFGGQSPVAPPPDVRICSRCKQIKSYPEFSKRRKSAASGLQHYCKQCDAIQARCSRDRVRANGASDTSARDTLSYQSSE